MTYLLLKYCHLLSAVIMLGTTLCNGILRFHTNGTRQSHHMAAISTGVTALNRILLGPSLTLLLLTGLAMTLSRWSFDMAWLQWSLGLYGLLLLAFILGYAEERRLERLAVDAFDNGQHEPDPRYWQVMRRATPIGLGATLVSLWILFMMLAKPM
ncbi:DUF2269 family protein [Saccharospirillum salsuginis]|uniref:DUF2269 family protein n=1 Tax=Saccharospirillum salsuginis TaxID=418750 RepID=A0A918KM68_9GAMM|nr:DUF2269 family protein [Saccharospirillum salsuginis]GGX68516.1 hypothetical protein GCM10007392_40110 [Saccharospirillum salsuginis]